VVEEAHDRLLQMIVDGELVPGSRLLQMRLAEELGVSRTPIREALLQLEREGLVYTLPGRGMFVKSATHTEVLEFYEMRGLVEPHAARRAAERASADDIARVQAVQQRLEQPNSDMSEALRLNAGLHQALVAPCGNRMLIRLLAGFWAQEQALRAYALQMSSHPRGVTRMKQEHRAITAAFAAGDGERVEQLVREHIRDAVDLLKERQAAVEAGADAEGVAG
jgi:DNA-binding GntR family transcriptional regulator